MRGFGTRIRGTLSTSALAGVTLSALAGTSALYAEEPQPYVRQASQRVTATVDSIDAKTRKVVVIVPPGDREEFTVDPEVRNLEQLKPGDRVVVNYKVGVAARVQPPGTAAQAPVYTEQLSRATPGAKPGGAVARSITSTVKIESVDAATNTVKFRRADGTVDTVSVESPAAQEKVKQLKPGDAVQVTYTEAMAVSVQPALR